MVDNREREEVHKAIWAIADDLRGKVDGWDFKSYVLGIMFYRYISENLTNYINEGERKAGDIDFDYTKLDDSDAEPERANLVKEKGFFILPSELFENVLKRAKDDDNLNETLEKIFNNIENSAKGTGSEKNFSGLFDDIDVNSNKLGKTVVDRNKTLLRVLEGIASINLGNYQDNKIDAFGDAYEFLMSMYASDAGKSGGEYYTPQEVSELLTRLATVGKTSVNKVYDPACGSGSLLLKSAKILGRENVRIGFYGQESNITTYNLCRINMFLHDIEYDKFDIAHGDTLISPQHWDDEPFEVIVSNPPYSTKWEGNDNPLLINDPRYAPAGVLAPKRFADFAFIMHSLSWLATNGTASIVCFPGILYRGSAEKKIRKYLIDNNFIDSIIQLPKNLFFGTDIVTCIMVLKKGKTDNNVLFIDASNEYIKVINNNKLSDENIDNIISMFKNRGDKQYLSKLVSNEGIAQNNYNLSVSTYVEKRNINEKIDIIGINEEIDYIMNKERSLYAEIEKLIKESKHSINYINQLIEKICPFGVKYLSIGSIIKRNREKAGKKSDIKQVYVVSKSKGLIKAEEYRDNTVHSEDTSNYLILKKGMFAYNPSRLNIGSIGIMRDEIGLVSPMYVVFSIDNNIINERFFEYLLESAYVKGKIDAYKEEGARFRFDFKRWSWIDIPIPPFDVQCEIVRILDKFTLLIGEISEEIVFRQKQYEYYRDELLTFKELN